ncbi:Patched domain-containing protein 3 [Toxocara canis]|uniref:Patched domain-containing protein 3 n=1 Tax=Toxocara canis TaxID=6265 RepID=A0A0B2V7D0_TOXCA|nr:Patched domain-containing protein 3 [Toxocara canis]
MEKVWANLLGRYCRFIAGHPWPFIITPAVLTCLLSAGIFLNFKIVRGVHYLYAPLNAQWKLEEDVFHRNWAATDEQFYPGKDILRRKGLYVMLEAKDCGNVLRRPYASEFVRFLEWLNTEKFTTVDGLEYSYRNICLRFQNDCFMNAHARFLADIFFRGDQEILNVTYPKFYSQYSTEPIDLSNTLGGVRTDSRQRLLNATTWMILYQLKQHSDLMMKLSSDFEIAVSERINTERVPTKLFNVYYFHSDTFDLELAKNNHRIAPRFALTFTLLAIFSVLCTFNVEWANTTKGVTPVIDWVISKPLMGIVGVVATVMAITSATGLLLLLDVTFVDVVSVMPFLSLTIGIDDTFLMLAAWHETSRMLSVEDRIEASMRHAAVSVSITSLTDALAFLIGSIAPLPAVIYFCYYSCAAICFIFVYSLTIFVACLSIQGRWEESHRNSVVCIPTVPMEEIEKSTLLERYLNMGSRSDTELKKQKALSCSLPKEMIIDNRLWYQRFFEDFYAPFITRFDVQMASLISFVAYFTIASFGVINVRVGFDLVNLIQKDSPSRRFLEIRSQLFPDDVSKLDVAVMHPPNMGDPVQRKLFLTALNDLEHTSCSLGRNGTDFWYFAYQRYVTRLGFGDSWTNLNENETVSFVKKTFKSYCSYAENLLLLRTKSLMHDFFQISWLC